MAAGIIWAYFSISEGFNEFTKDWVAPFGTIFIRALKFIAIPLVMFSIIVGISSLKDITKLGRIGAKTLATYLVTTVLAVTIGLVFVNVAKPGNSISEDQRIKNRISYELWVKATDGVEFKDELRYSEDPAYAQVITELSGAEVVVNEKVDNVSQEIAAKKDASPLAPLVEMVPENIVLSLGNPKLMLQVIVFAIFFGICMLFIPEDRSAPVINLFDGINEVFLKMVDVVMKAAPFFVFALMAAKLSSMANSTEELLALLNSLGQYSLVVFVGLLFLIFLYPLFVKLFVKKMQYFDFWRKISPAQLTAFSTSSSDRKSVV